MIRNYMECVVDNWMPKMLSEYDDICTCERCIEDIKAIALNGLNPAYVATRKGEVYAKINELQAQFSTDAIRELTKAIEIVSKNPKHD
ncbi:MAG: late competence development ComFB family protein [Clostridia bacterium]|nr:late competence development ComFB family protein [Clostridia bacterium]